MFVLVEPFKQGDIIDRPDLGCAMLVASCKANGINVKLVETQVNYIKSLFKEDVENTSSMICEQDEKVWDRPDFKFVKNFLFGKSNVEIQKYLKGLYELVILNKSYQTYLNNSLINEFTQLFKVLMQLSWDLCETGGEIPFLKYFEEEILKYQPEIVGFSLYNDDIFSKILRNRLNKLGIKIVVGGAFISKLDENEIANLINNDSIDYLIRGPGELALPALLNVIRNGRVFEDVPNLVYKENGQLIYNKVQHIEYMDALPAPDFSQFSLDEYITPEVILPLQSARGCSWRRCSFCTHHKSYLNKYVCYSEEKFVEILKKYKKEYRCDFIVLHDEELPPERARMLSRAILNSKELKPNIYSYARLVDGFDKDTLKLMYKAGFKTISWGLESGSDKVLKDMQKGFNVQTAEDVLRRSYETGLSNICWIIFGFPGENVEEASDTENFLKRNQTYIDMALISKFQLEKGSPIYRKLVEKGNNGVLKPYSYDVDKFVRNLEVKIQLGCIDISNKRYGNLIYTNLARIMLFIMSSKQIRRVEETSFSKEILKESSSYPIILGRLSPEEAGFYCENNKESVLSHIMKQRKPVKLEDHVKRCVSYCDGKTSFDDIVKICNISGTNQQMEVLNFLKYASEQGSLMTMQKNLNE